MVLGVWMVLGVCMLGLRALPRTCMLQGLHTLLGACMLQGLHTLLGACAVLGLHTLLRCSCIPLFACLGGSTLRKHCVLIVACLFQLR